MITTAFRLLGGVMTGGGMMMSYRSLKSVQQGQTVFIAYKQSTVLCDLARSTFELLEDMDRASPSTPYRNWVARAIAYPLPFALQILHYNVDAKQHPQIRKAVDTARAHIEHVALAIDVVVSALFAYYVAPYFGVGVLIGISIEVLNEEKVLSGKIKDIWEKAWLGLAFSRLFKLALFKNNNLGELGLFTCELGTFTWEHYLSDYFPKAEAKSTSYHERKARVQWAHLEENPNLTIKGASNLKISETMEYLTGKVEWTDENLKALKGHLQLDPIFSESGIELTDENAKDYFYTNAKRLANEIEHSTIQKGDSYIRYEVLQAMLRSDLKALKDNFDDDPSALSDLFQLAISGGDYCGGGKAETIENIYKRRVIHGKDVPLRVKFLHLLASMRKKWFDHLYGRVTQLSYRLPKGVFDAADIHFYNVSLFYFDKSLKLHSEAIKNDMNITETAFCSRFFRLLLSTTLDYTFWLYALCSSHWYSPEAILDEITDACGENGLSLTVLNQWWIKWVEQQNYSPERKEELIESITNEEKIFEESILEKVDRKQKPNPRLLKRMFFEMGILE